MGDPRVVGAGCYSRIKGLMANYITFMAVLCYAVIFGFFGAWVANQRGRSDEEGLFLGIVFGPLGVIVEALLPRK